MATSEAWAVEPRDAVIVGGPGAGTYLHSQLSQSVDDLDLGDSRWTLVLQPDGHVEVVARVWRRTSDEYVLDTDAGYGDVLGTRLRRFMIRVDAGVTREALIATVALPGAGAASATNDAAVVGWWGTGTVRLAGTASLPEGVTDAGGEALAAARVVAGWPAMGAEIAPGERLPAEIGLAGVAVNLRKGCYPGQELVERMDSRGAQAPRRLCQLDVEPGAAPGDPIIVDGAEVGELTSVAGTLALGYVKRGVDHGRPVASLAPGSTR